MKKRFKELINNISINEKVVWYSLLHETVSQLLTVEQFDVSGNGNS
jgi:hypothetical protein